MSEIRIQSSRFKATCLALLDEVHRHHTTVVITKRGQPVAKLVPLDEPATIGSVTLVADDDEPYFSTGIAWNADN